MNKPYTLGVMRNMDIILSIIGTIIVINGVIFSWYIFTKINSWIWKET